MNDLNPASPHALPDTIDYHHVIALLQGLCPTIDPTRVSWVRIDYRDVKVEVWTGARAELHTMRITHPQGSATEGGQAT